MSAQPQILVALAVTLFVAALFALGMGTRGGRFRALPGWIAFWVLFAALLVILSRAPRSYSLPLLGLVMFACLREFSYLAPVRPQDRWAVMIGYVTIPAALYPVFGGSYGLFLAIVLLTLFLLVPAVISVGAQAHGMLDSMGRIVLGILVFILGAAHLGWMGRLPTGSIELFGILVLVTDLPERLLGRLRPGRGVLSGAGGMLLAAALAAGTGAWCAPWIEMAPMKGAIAGLLVAVSVTVGGLVTEAATADLALDTAASRVGRAALLDRIIPAIYAAPLYFHFLNRFA